jgi:hypothetical protein
MFCIQIANGSIEQTISVVVIPGFSRIENGNAVTKIMKVAQNSRLDLFTMLLSEEIFSRYDW